MATIDIFNIQKEKVGELDLNDAIFGSRSGATCSTKW